jgi:hypothetical protein
MATSYPIQFSIQNYSILQFNYLFACSLFNEAVSNSDYIALND